MTRSLRSRLREYWENHLKDIVTVTALIILLPLLLILYILYSVVSKRHLALPYARAFCYTLIGRYRVRYQRPPAYFTCTVSFECLSRGWRSFNIRFHRLPPVILQRIYRYLLPPGGLIIQPELKRGEFGVRWGLLPRIARSGEVKYKFIRDDSDAPSEALRSSLSRGGWYLNQSGEPLVPEPSSTSGSTSCRNLRNNNNPATTVSLICGYGSAIPADHLYHTELLTRTTTHLTFMRVTWRSYTDLHDALYDTHTFSFFVPEVLTFFIDNASPQGLRRTDPLCASCSLGYPFGVPRAGLEKPSGVWHALTSLDAYGTCRAES
ncbi:hypothetical protein BJX65DRAFT_302015 [Aspergillus insuetus]